MASVNDPTEAASAEEPEEPPGADAGVWATSFDPEDGVGETAMVELGDPATGENATGKNIEPVSRIWKCHTNWISLKKGNNKPKHNCSFHELILIDKELNRAQLSSILYFFQSSSYMKNTNLNPI